MLKIKYVLKDKFCRRTQLFKPEELLPFGILRSDHMFLMDYADSKWREPRIVPYQNISLHPGALGLSYAMSVFEGIKAFKHNDGEIYLFRIDKYVERFNQSAQKLCMPKILPEEHIQAINALINVDRLWFPEQEDSSFYIRPLLFATEDCLTVRPSRTYTFCVFLSPSGPYYQKCFNTIKLYLTQKYKRAIPFLGKAKAGLNYGGTLLPLQKAKELGADQVLYTDFTNTLIEEAGIMNHYHVTNKKVIVIPTFTNFILESITTRSIMDLSKELGYKIEQQNVIFKKFLNDVRKRKIVEAGGLGTAAVVLPVGSYILDNGKEIPVGDGKPGPITKIMSSFLTDIQMGRRPAPSGWLKKVPKIR